jgi:hypothetical protein
VVGQGGGENIFNGLFIKTIWDLCSIEDLEKDEQVGGGWVIRGQVTGVVALAVVIIIGVQGGDGFICFVGFIGHSTDLAFGTVGLISQVDSSGDGRS